MPMISVIVCTYNRAPTLRRMLEGFYLQHDLNRLEHELIVVDNNSTDDTPRTAEAFSMKPGFRYIREDRQGLSFARNCGINNAAGDFVAFLDDDVIVDPRWLGNLRICLDEMNPDAVGGKVDLQFQTPPPVWLGPLFRMHLAELDLAPTRLVGLDRSGYNGCNVTFRKQALLGVGGFDATLGRIGTQLRCYEETVVLYRIQSTGGKLVYDAAVRVEHIVGPERMTWPYFKRLVISQGISLAMLEIDGAVMSRLLALLSGLGLGRICKGYFDGHRQPTKTILLERHPPLSKWLKLILVDFSFLVTAIFKTAITYMSFGNSYKRKAGQASVLTAVSLVLQRWKNLLNSNALNINLDLRYRLKNMLFRILPGGYGYYRKLKKYRDPQYVHERDKHPVRHKHHGGGGWKEDQGEICYRDYASYDEYVTHQIQKWNEKLKGEGGFESKDILAYRRKFYRRFRHLKRFIPLSADILCAGARQGTEVEVLRDLGYHKSWGIDLNPGPDNPLVVAGDFMHIERPDSSLDLLYSNSVDHAFNLDAFFSEHARAIKPDGYALYDLSIQEGGPFEAVAWKHEETIFLMMLKYFSKVIEVRTDGDWKWILLQGKK